MTQDTLTVLRAALTHMEGVEKRMAYTAERAGEVQKIYSDFRTLIASMEAAVPAAFIAVNKSYKERRAELTFYPKSSWFNNHEITPLYTHAQPVEQPALSDAEIWKFWWDKPEVEEGEDDSMEAQFVSACRRAIEQATEGVRHD